jgi:hypothetical protein
MGDACLPTAKRKRDWKLKKILKYSVLGLALAVSASTSVHADARHHDRPREEPRTAPEVDPSVAIAGFTLLAGMLTVLRARRGN